VADDLHDWPDVFLDEDLCRLFRLKPRALQRTRRLRPDRLPEPLPSIDRHTRTSKAAVLRFLAGERDVRLMRKRA
jgi:hypothetical protein